MKKKKVIYITTALLSVFLMVTAKLFVPPVSSFLEASAILILVYLTDLPLSIIFFYSAHKYAQGA